MATLGHGWARLRYTKTTGHSSVDSQSNAGCCHRAGFKLTWIAVTDAQRQRAAAAMSKLAADVGSVANAYGRVSEH
jgi:hypothetical protein